MEAAIEVAIEAAAEVAAEEAVAVMVAAAARVVEAAMVTNLLAATAPPVINRAPSASIAINRAAAAPTAVVVAITAPELAMTLHLLVLRELQITLPSVLVALKALLRLQPRISRQLAPKSWKQSALQLKNSALELENSARQLAVQLENSARQLALRPESSAVQVESNPPCPKQRNQNSGDDTYILLDWLTLDNTLIQFKILGCPLDSLDLLI
jgi:hypothetical protein